MRRTLGTAAILLASGCLGDLVNIGEGPEKKGGGGKETGGASGTSASSGASGASGRSGASGTSGTGDAGGDGGAGADSGGSTSTGGATGGGNGGSAGSVAGGASGGTGGTSGTGEPTSDPDVIARAAVALGSCIGDDGVSRNASELWYWQEDAGFWSNYRLQAACIADAGRGCGALDTCLGWAIEEKPGCAPGRVCDGSRFRDCIEGEGVGTIEQRFDCATIGLQCNTSVVCARDPAVDCELMDFVDRCVGDLPQRCEEDAEGPVSGVLFEGPDCGVFGLECVAMSPGGDEAVRAACTGSGDSCEFDSFMFMTGIACAGDTLAACVNGRRHDFDCSIYGPGFSCQTYEGVPFCGLSSECLPGNINLDISQQGKPEPTCNGSSIVFCNAGRLESIDCTSLGFTGCDLEAGLGCVPSPTSDLRR